jgi:hypothetical protein
MAHPYEVLAPHCEIVVASPLGGAAPLDPSSVEAFKSDAVSTRFPADAGGRVEEHAAAVVAAGARARVRGHLLRRRPRAHVRPRRGQGRRRRVPRARPRWRSCGSAVFHAKASLLHHQGHRVMHHLCRCAGNISQHLTRGDPIGNIGMT